MCKQTHQFRPKPGQRSIDLRSPQLFVGLVAPADAHWSADGAGLLGRFLGLSRCSEGMDQPVLNVFQDHGGQSVLALAVSVHAVRLNVASSIVWETFLLHSGYCPSSLRIRTSMCACLQQLQSSLPGAELALFCHCYYGEPALCLHALPPPPPPPFDCVNKNSGRSRTKTIVASEKE